MVIEGKSLQEGVPTPDEPIIIKHNLDIKYELISAFEKLTIDNNWEDMVRKYTKEIIAAKEQALTQYVMKKQQDEIDRLREENKKLREMLEDKVKCK